MIFIFLYTLYTIIITQSESNGVVPSSPWKRDPQTLGERLFLVRNEHGLTWGQVAHLLGVATLDVAAYEQGDPVPQCVLVEFSAALSVSWD